MNTSIPRPEYPRMQFRRDQWLNLNGTWSCELDQGMSGHDRKFFLSQGFATPINVPFCVESKLSGVGHRDFVNQVFYHRVLEIPQNWAGRRVILNFGAVNYDSHIYLDGVECARHIGGSAAFAVDLTKLVRPGATHHLVVSAANDVRSGVQMSGKQCYKHDSEGCFYTRVTGIWQTVYLECAGMAGLKSCRIVPNLDDASFAFMPEFYLDKPGNNWEAEVFADGKCVGAAAGPAIAGAPLAVKLSDPQPWSPEHPFLYEVKWTVRNQDGQVEDTVHSYAGLRKIHIEGNRIFLNNRPLYQRLVLDQGFYPDGVWTAPSDEALEKDIRLSQSCGFNGARLHQKVFEPRFHYHADRLGYLTWGEAASWGTACTAESAVSRGTWMESAYNALNEWREIVTQNINYPSIILWTPLNETQCDENHISLQRNFIEQLYQLTRALDATRPFHDSSGYIHQKSDIWSLHYYAADAKELAQALTPPAEPEYPGQLYRFTDPLSLYTKISRFDCPYSGQPFLLDEFGGFRFAPRDLQDGWGYHGLNMKTDDELLDKIREQVEVILNDKRICGFCYTQLTDVEQEQNGLFFYDRTPKTSPEKIAKIFGQMNT